MYTASVMSHFCSENRLSKILFSNPFPKKCSDCESQKSTHQSVDFTDSWSVFGFALQKKTQYLFLDSKIWIWIIPKKTHPLRSWSERVFISQRSVYTNDTADWFRVCSNCVKLKKTTRKTHIVINCVKLKFKTNEKDVHCFREDLNFSVCLSLKD